MASLIIEAKGISEMWSIIASAFSSLITADKEIVLLYTPGQRILHLFPGLGMEALVVVLFKVSQPGLDHASVVLAATVLVDV